jgi:hypothetical protein
MGCEFKQGVLAAIMLKSRNRSAGLGFAMLKEL